MASTQGRSDKGCVCLAIGGIDGRGLPVGVWAGMSSLAGEAGHGGKGRGGVGPAPTDPGEETVASRWVGCDGVNKAESSPAPARAEEGAHGPSLAGRPCSDNSGDER